MLKALTLRGPESGFSALTLALILKYIFRCGSSTCQERWKVPAVLLAGDSCGTPLDDQCDIKTAIFELEFFAIFCSFHVARPAERSSTCCLH